MQIIFYLEGSSCAATNFDQNVSGEMHTKIGLYMYIRKSSNFISSFLGFLIEKVEKLDKFW